HAATRGIVAARFRPGGDDGARVIEFDRSVELFAGAVALRPARTREADARLRDRRHDLVAQDLGQLKWIDVGPRERLDERRSGLGREDSPARAAQLDQPGE